MAVLDQTEREVDPRLQKELQEHPGKWAAITANELVAVGESPAEVLEKAKAKGYDSPTLYRIPEDDRIFFF